MTESNLWQLKALISSGGDSRRQTEPALFNHWSQVHLFFSSPPHKLPFNGEWRTLGATDSPLQRTSLRSPALLKRMEASKGMPHLIMLLASASAEENPTKDQCSTQHDVGAKWLFQGYPNWECVRECAWYVSLWFFNFSPYRVFQTCASLQAPSSMPLEGLS